VIQPNLCHINIMSARDAFDVNDSRIGPSYASGYDGHVDDELRDSI